jgi:hypothetical protein
LKKKSRPQIFTIYRNFEIINQNSIFLLSMLSHRWESMILGKKLWLGKKMIAGG